MSSRVRISDIAARAGVSPATVSRILNDPQRVRAMTRDRIYSAMAQLDYLPPAAHRDSGKLSGIIGVFAPNLLLDSVTELVRAIEQQLSDTSFDILLVNMRMNRDFEWFITGNSHILRKIDGAVIFSADLSEKAVSFMKSADVPVVLMQARSRLVRSVSNNNFLGGQDAAAHLIECGYRRIAFVGWEPNDDHVADRLAGFRATLARSGSDLRDDDIAIGSLSAAGGYEATRVLLSNGNPDAVFYACDVMALGGMRRLRESGFRIPDDIGVMGFDDLSVAEAVGLTSMQQFFATKAEMIVKYLLGRISGEIRTDQCEELQVSPRLVKRETTALTQGRMDSTTAVGG
jgi:DNA-binding LacI/PurR family transcriptional regulator